MVLFSRWCSGVMTVIIASKLWQMGAWYFSRGWRRVTHPSVAPAWRPIRQPCTCVRSSPVSETEPGPRPRQRLVVCLCLCVHLSSHHAHACQPNLQGLAFCPGWLQAPKPPTSSLPRRPDSTSSQTNKQSSASATQEQQPVAKRGDLVCRLPCPSPSPFFPVAEAPERKTKRAEPRRTALPCPAQRRRVRVEVEVEGVIIEARGRARPAPRCYLARKRGDRIRIAPTKPIRSIDQPVPGSSINESERVPSTSPFRCGPGGRRERERGRKRDGVGVPRGGGVRLPVQGGADRGQRRGQVEPAVAVRQGRVQPRDQVHHRRRVRHQDRPGRRQARQGADLGHRRAGEVLRPSFPLLSLLFVRYADCRCTS